MTGNEALALAAARLRAAGIEGAARDARWLLAHALECAPDRLTLLLTEHLDASAVQRFEALVTHRAARHPVSHLLGGRYFYDHWFEVTPDVLDPRAETELLVELALAAPFARVLDLGTGSGAIVISLLAARPGATGVGSDVSGRALQVAARNGVALGVADRVTWSQADWFAGLSGRFDLIVSNPPYIAADEMEALEPEVRQYEPRLALTDEADGLGAYRAIAGGAAQYLAPGGRLLVEIGQTQGEAVAALFGASGLGEITVQPDLAGRARVVTATKAQKSPQSGKNRAS